MKKMSFTVNGSECALMYKKGIPAAILGPGKYSTLGGREYNSMSLDCDIIALTGCTADALRKAEGADSITITDVADRTIALHYVDGHFVGALNAGTHAFFNAAGKHEFKTVDTSDPVVSDDIPVYIFETLSGRYYTEIHVSEYQKARVYFNNKLHSVLDAGRYFFWNTENTVSFDFVDTRLLQCDIPGQEMLTRDKVTIRVNFVCNYKITDFVKISAEVDNYENQLYTAAQLSLREYVGAHTLDEILENKKDMGRAVLGELTVKAQANVITRREEVASTRSLLNTAKLMEENATLYKLKELEYVEKICRNVGNINVTGGDMLSQLTEILRGHKEN